MPRKTNYYLNERKRLDDIAKDFSMGKDFNAKLEKYKLIKIREDAKNGEILEVGCADGFLTKGLARYFKHITAIDASKKLIEKAKKHNLNNVIYKQTLFERFVPEFKFDTIILAEILEHVINPSQLLKLSREWLKEDGAIIIISPNAYSIHRQIGKLANMLKDIHDLNKTDIGVGHRRVYDHKLMAKDITNAGLKILKADGIFFKPLSNEQMNTLNQKTIDAFFEIGKKFPPEFLAQLYFVCGK